MELLQPDLTTIGESVLAKRYLVRNEEGEIIETPQERFVAVAKYVAQAERNYGVEPDTIWPRYYKSMARRDFMPNTPCLVNAGRTNTTNDALLSACIVLPIEDTMGDIFGTLRDMALCHKMGAGCIGGESVVLTDQGPVSMQTLVDSQLPRRVLSYKTDAPAQFTPVGDYHRTTLPAGRIYEVEFDGASIRASDWHPFYVWRGDSIEEVRADSLVPGDAVIGSTRWDGAVGKLSDRAWLAGFIVSDGGFDHSVNGLRLRICKGYERPIARAAQILDINYGPSRDPRYQSPVWELCTVGPKAEYVREQFGKDQFDVYTKRLPAWIWAAEVQEQLSLLVGLLDGDGWFSDDHNAFCYGSVSARLIEEVEALAGMVGLRTRRRTQDAKPEKNEEPFYSLSFARSPWLVDLMRMHSTRHNPSWGYTNGVIPLSKIYLGRLAEMGYPVESNTTKRKGLEIGGYHVAIQRYYYEGIATREVAALILAACGDRAAAAAVHSARIVQHVQAADKEDTLYDLTVPGPQNYIAGCNGFVVAHNTGFSFSRLRPAGDFVQSTTGLASGPISFMRAYNNVTECVKQSGMRRGANMAVLRCDHPDILQFIDCKRDPNELCNFNISVGITNAFMAALAADETYSLINPRTGLETSCLRARDVFDRIVANAHYSGEPGLLFLDRVNELDPLATADDPIEATNPCGEQPLHPYDACDLGSLNLVNFYDQRLRELDLTRLAETIQLAVRFLDNVHDVNQYPVPQLKERTRNNRRIGLGVMGWADLLIKMGIPYASQQALALAESTMQFINAKAVEASEELARLRGAFPLFEQSKHFTNKCKPRRNATVTTIAPTGSISIIAGCSSGIEPLFAIVQTRKQADMEMVDINPMFVEIAKREGFYDEALIGRVREKGTIRDDPAVPRQWQRVFAIANEIDSEYHVKMQAAFQRHVECAVSKTINMHSSAAIDDVERAYMLAWEEGCKGITIYRDGCRQGQTLTVGAVASKEERAELHPIPTGVYDLIGQLTQTPTGKLSVKLGLDNNHRPFEAWLDVSRAGTAVSADCEAIARLASLVLRMDSPIVPERRLHLIADQLAGIGGGDSVGFGPERVLSLPDGIAKALRSLAGALEARRVAREASAALASLEAPTPATKPSNGHGNGNGNGNGKGNGHKHSFGDICPDCHQVALHYGEGCAKCALCGFSRC